MNKAILYSFRRCPYAMRARLAIAVSGVQVELREVELRDKPTDMLDISPKGTVPVLLTTENNVIDESLDIMLWALQQFDPDNWLQSDNDKISLSKQLIQHNDGEFKYYLDRYKYADRYPEYSQQYYRQQAEKTLLQLEQLLATNGYLTSAIISLVDIAIFPFIRQFAFVDQAWFFRSAYPLLNRWLQQFIESVLFESTMTKYPKWQENNLYYFPID